MAKMNLRKWIKRNILHSYMSSEDVLNKLRENGAVIGSDVIIHAPGNTMIDGSRAFLLTIGDHVRIAEGVKILTHDYSWSVLKQFESDSIVPGRILGAESPVTIGSNVFIGMNAIVTRGVTIGDRVVIGAGSVVTKDCSSDGVYAGNPARRIMDLETFYRKREALQFLEAKTMALRYKERFGTVPPKEIFSEYFMLFSTREEAVKVRIFREQMSRMGSGVNTDAYMDNHKPMFADYDAFLEACYQSERD